MDKFVKIVYFDESYATDYCQLAVGGMLTERRENATETEKQAHGNAEEELSINSEKGGLATLIKLVGGLTANMKVSGGTEASAKTDRIAKKIIENTVLSTFVDVLSKDGNANAGIHIFKGVNVHPEPNSFTYMMLIAPFMSMVNGQLPIESENGKDIHIDINKVEAAMEHGRGYYEFTTYINEKEAILRFNRNAFRNGYTLSDLPKMQLTYYAIPVGKIEKSVLQVQKEFEFGISKKEVRVDFAAETDDEQEEKRNLIGVYDVILGGVTL